jgi:hypothetical protein
LTTSNFVAVLSGVALATSGIVFGLCLPSSAAQLWDWSYSGGGSLGGSGTFTTDDGPSPYLVTGITGTVEQNTITSLKQVGSIGNDNLLYSLPTFPQFTNLSGVGFNTSSTPDNYFGNLISLGFPLTSLIGPGVFSVDFAATLRQQPPSTTPEPSSLLSFITLGGLMLGGVVSGARK